MNNLNEIERGQLCQTTIEAFYSATGGLNSVPGLLKKIIVNRAWERRVNKGKVIELASLRELITSKPIRGWGEDPKKVEAVIKDHPEVLAMYREAMKLKCGRKEQENYHNNVMVIEQTPKQGNSKAYTLSRLEREAPELFKAVCDGKTTANAAAIEAGFRQKTFTVVAGDSVRAVKSLLKHYSKDDILDAIAICD
jgi:hypothetical protein